MHADASLEGAGEFLRCLMIELYLLIDNMTVSLNEHPVPLCTANFIRENITVYA